MKRKIIIAISALLVFTMLLSSTSVIGFAGVEGYQVGDIIEFGSYPQSEVKNSVTLTALNLQIPKLNWISYGYYSGTDSYGSMVQGDWMKYADTTYNGNNYRAVKFTQYRPYWTEYSSSASNSYQDDNGYVINTVYWFEYEPIEWRVLDSAKGLVMTETCIDSQAYSNTIYSYNGYYWNDTAHTHYASDYLTSSLRKWLNDDFYNTAFNDSQKSQIATATLDDASSCSSEDASATINDKVFLLSYYDVTNSAYGFSSTASDYDAARRAKSTDYARSQGCYSFSGGSYADNADWFLRSLHDGYAANSVSSVGDAYGRSYVIDTYLGVRPALMLNLKNKIIINNLGTKTINYGDGIKFTATTTVLPEGAKIVWFVDGNKAGEGESFTFSDAKADATITVKIVDKDGNVIKDSSGDEISESEKITVKAGFFQKLISFFKNLFKIDRIVVQSIDSKNAY